MFKEPATTDFILGLACGLVAGFVAGVAYMMLMRWLIGG